MNNTSRIAVLGSNSFAGSQFVDSALNKGYEVIGLSRSMEKPHVFATYNSNTNIGNFRFQQTDINRNFQKVTELLAEFQPSFIVDFAGQGMVAESWQRPEEWYQTNFVSKVKLHDFLRYQTWLKKYIRVSTPEVYGNMDSLGRESENYHPSTPYAVSHAAIDLSLMAFHAFYDFPVIIGRFANFYGPGQQLYRIIPKTILKIRRGEKLLLHGGGTSNRAFLFSTDTSEAIHDLIEKANTGEIFHFSPTEVFSIRNVVEQIATEMGVKFSDVVEIAEERPGKDAAYMMNSTKALENLGWEAKVSLKEGIGHTIEWVNRNYSVLRDLNFEYVHKV